ncbi:hypothetical protein BT69DRAFT_1345911 [Atractiella rhizophila]|nr:hypothetical protein BT69DRAFT_1345911 [Atractiella rhizophila]
MSTVDTSNPASAKRKRDPSSKHEACDPCRIRKVRCDGEFPCAACKRSQKALRGSTIARVCTYNMTPTRKPRYFLTSTRQPELSEKSGNTVSSSSSDAEIATKVADGSVLNGQRRKRSRSRDDDEHNVSTAGGDSVSTSTGSVTDINSQAHLDSSEPSALQRPLSPWPDNLPPRDVTILLIFAAYDRCTLLTDIVSFPKFMITLQYGTEPSRAFIALVHAICLLGAYGLTDQYLDKILSRCRPTPYWQEDSDDSRKRAVIKYHTSHITPAVFGMEESTLDDEEQLIHLVKAMLCMTMFFHVDGQWPSLPIWNSMTVRICVLLGLNKTHRRALGALNVSEDSIPSDDEREREMLFWHAVSTEQYCSALTNTPPSLALEDIVASLPSSSSMAAFESKLDIRHPQFFQVTRRGLLNYEAHQLYFKVALLGEVIVRFMRRHESSPLNRESAEFKNHHKLLRDYIEHFPRRYIDLSSMQKDLTLEERREKQYYFMAYTLLNTLMIILHSGSFSFDPTDLSMVSSYRCAKNIFAQMDNLKENYDSTRFADNNFCIGSFALACRILIREMMIKQSAELKADESLGDSSFSIELQCRKFLHWMAKLSRTWETAASYTPRLLEFLNDPRLLIPSKTCLTKENRVVLQE